MKYISVILATHNLGKVEQVNKILKQNKIDLKVISAAEIGFTNEVEEDGKSFEENAEIKAKAVYEYCKEKQINNVIIIADDSGLCIDKLNGEPGVHSSRYAGENATDNEKRMYILEKMKAYKDENDRSAKFVTSMVAILPDGNKIAASGVCNGKIANEIGKTYNRLTYNQLFIPDGFDKTISEMNDDEFKNVHNHREKAILDLIKKIKI